MRPNIDEPIGFSLGYVIIDPIVGKAMQYFIVNGSFIYFLLMRKREIIINECHCVALNMHCYLEWINACKLDQNAANYSFDREFC